MGLCESWLIISVAGVRSAAPAPHRAISCALAIHVFTAPVRSILVFGLIDIAPIAFIITIAPAPRRAASLAFAEAVVRTLVWPQRIFGLVDHASILRRWLRRRIVFAVIFTLTPAPSWTGSSTAAVFVHFASVASSLILCLIDVATAWINVLATWFTLAPAE